ASNEMSNLYSDTKKHRSRGENEGSVDYTLQSGEEIAIWQQILVVNFNSGARYELSTYSTVTTPNSSIEPGTATYEQYLNDQGNQNNNFVSDDVPYDDGQNHQGIMSPIETPQSQNEWTYLDWEGKDVAVDVKGNTWIINQENEVAFHDGKSWQMFPHAIRARAIAVDGESTPWVVGQDGLIYKGTQQFGWERISGASGQDIAVDGNGIPWIISHDNTIHYYDGLSWQFYSDVLGKRIAADGNSVAWIIGMDNQVYRMDTSMSIGGAGIDISVDRFGMPWVIGTDNMVYYNDGMDWQLFSPQAGGKAISLNRNGRLCITDGEDAIWGISSEIKKQETPNLVNPNDNYNDNNNDKHPQDTLPTFVDANIQDEWTNLNWSGKDIAVDGNGHPWIIDPNNEVAFHDGANWQMFPHSIQAKAIAVEANGTPWVIGLHDNIIYKGTHAGGWQSFGGPALDIAVDTNGTPWMVRLDNGLYSHGGSYWELYSQDVFSTKVVVDRGGNPWIIDLDGAVYRAENGAWTLMGEGAEDIAVDGIGIPWIIGADKVIYFHNAVNWKPFPQGGTGKAISINQDGVLSIVGEDDTIWQISSYKGVRQGGSIEGSTWAYYHNGHPFDIRFGESGFIELLPSWANVQWRTLNDAQVELYVEGNSTTMILNFDDSKTNFSTVNWEGNHATGNRV
ncbi:MAG: hypothetical protein AB8B69_06875, partial [Chitinophagales bacterium]